MSWAEVAEFEESYVYERLLLGRGHHADVRMVWRQHPFENLDVANAEATVGNVATFVIAALLNKRFASLPEV